MINYITELLLVSISYDQLPTEHIRLYSLCLEIYDHLSEASINTAKLAIHVKTFFNILKNCGAKQRGEGSSH